MSSENKYATEDIWAIQGEGPEEQEAPRPEELPDDVPNVPVVKSTAIPFTREEAGLEELPVFNEEAFHADTQSVADSRTLSSRIIKAPARPSPLNQGHSFAADMAKGVTQPSIEDMQAKIDEQKRTDPAYRAAYRDSMSDSDMTSETLDWLGTTRWNMVKTGNLAFDVGDWSDEEQVALVRLMAQYEELPISLATTRRAFEGLAGDPTTYIGLGFVLSALSKIALKPMAASAVKKMLLSTAGAGTVGAVEIGGYMGADNLMQQKIKIDTGQQGEYDVAEAATMTGIGVVAGFTLIGSLAAWTGKRAASKLVKNTDEVAEQVNEVAEQVNEVADEVIDEGVVQADEVIGEVVETPKVLDDLTDDFNPDDAATEADWLEDFEGDFADEFTDEDWGIVYDGSDSVDTVIEVTSGEKIKSTTVMPKGLAGSKPRYGYQGENFKIKFDSDVDKALFIVASKGSKAHDEHMRFLRGVFPDKLEEEIDEMAQSVKAKLKEGAKNGDVDLDGDLVINTMFEPSKKPRRPSGESKANDPKPSIYEEGNTRAMPYNVDRMSTSKDVQNLVLERAEKYLDENPRDSQTLEMVAEEGKVAAKELAESTGGDFNSIIKLLKGDLDAQRAITARIKSTRDLHAWTFGELKRLAYKHADTGIEGGLSRKEIVELLKVVEMTNALTPLTLKQSQSASQVLGSRRAMAIADDTLIRGGFVDDVQNTAEKALEAEAETILPVIDAQGMLAIENGNGPIVVDKLVKDIINGLESGKIKGPKEIRDLLEPSRWKKIVAEVNRVRAGSMLGGISTMTLAAVSNHFQMIYQPALEYVSRHNFGLTKASRASKMEDALARTRALAQYSGNMQYYKQGWKTAMKAVKMGVHISDPSVTHLESSAHQAGNQFKSKKRIIYENVTGYAHTVLMALDEQHKFTRAHSLAFADAVVEAKRLELTAKEQGKTSFKVGSEEYTKFIEKEIASKFDESGRVIDEAIMREVRMETFTEELVGPVGSLVNGIARMGGGVGAFVLPFRRAPVNSISYALQYAPLPELITKHISAKQKQILASGDKVQIAKLRARKKVGAMAIAYLWYTAESNELTGGGPSDWKMRKAWELAGNKPYTINIGGIPVPYEKIEPFSTIMGSVANAHYIWKMNPEKYQDGTASILEAIQMSVTHSILNKAYFQSINDWMKMLTGEDNKTTSVIYGAVTSFVPNMSNQMNRDPNVREATSLMEQVQRKLAGWSDELGAQYDVTGQPMLKPNDGWNLFKTPDVRADTQSVAKTVFQEIFDLRIVQDKEGLLGEPPRNLSAGRVDYREIYDRGEKESVYAKYNRFIGETEIRGESLESALYTLITSDKYMELQKSPYLDVNSPHVALLAKVVKRYRDKAKIRLLKESPIFEQMYQDLDFRKHEVKKQLF